MRPASILRFHIVLATLSCLAACSGEIDGYAYPADGSPAMNSGHEPPRSDGATDGGLSPAMHPSDLAPAPLILKEILYDSKDSELRTGIILQKGQTYAFSAEELTQWYDSTFRAGVDGWEKHHLLASIIKPLAKANTLPFYHLIGCVAKACFTIGKGNTIKTSTHGELVLFVNDVPLFFWNNHGTAKVTIKHSK